MQNVWQYFEAIRLQADPPCMQVVTTVVADIDNEIVGADNDENGETIITKSLVQYRECST